MSEANHRMHLVSLRKTLASATAFVCGIALAAPARAAADDFVDQPIAPTQTGAGPAQPTTQGAARPQAKPAAAKTAGPTAADADFTAQPIGQSAAAGTAPPPAAAPNRSPFAFMNNIERSAVAFGDLWGLRPDLARVGTTLTIQEQSELLGNLSGGTGKTAAYEGLTTATLQTDTQRAFGFYGGTFDVSALQIHGGNLSSERLQTLQTASGIEADRSTRLWELWYQQKFGDMVDVKVGQQSLDQEFMVTQNGSYFVNTMFGWPMLPSANLPGGGPAYPLSDLGLRGRVHLSDTVTLLAGVFNGSPVNSTVGDPQKNNPSGTSFPIGGGALAIAELQYAYPGPNTLVQAGQADPLARTYKIGMWWDTDQFADLRYDNTGLSLANPASTGTPLMHRGDYAFYAVADQMIYRFADDPDRNINVFVRPMFTPLQDRNLIAFSLNAGVTMHEPFFGRDDDTFGLGMGFAKVSSSASGLDADTAFYNPGSFAPIRSGETFVEATYQYEVAPWFQIQPDLQYVINPGAGVANSNAPGTKINNEWIVGVRANIQL